MSGRRIAGLTVAAALLAVLVVIVADGGEPAGLDARASTHNGDPRGLYAAWRYLEARGVPVERVDDALADRAPDAAVLVLSAPTRRRLEGETVSTALEVARQGGVLVILLPPEPWRTQPRLMDGLELRLRGDPPRPRGAPAFTGRERSLEIVPVVPDDPLLGGARTLLGAPARGLEWEGAEIVAQREEDGATTVLRRRSGEGWIYVLADASLLENHRLDLADNLHLLEGIAALARARSGTVLFDERHHRTPRPGEGPPRTSVAGWRAVAFQIALSTLVLMVAVGRRFGPVRPLVVDRRRSTLEYVENLAALYRRAGSEAELCQEVERDLRARLFERHGIPASLDDAEAARRLAARTGVAPEALLDTLEVLRGTPPSLEAAVRAVADLDARLEGRAVA